MKFKVGDHVRVSTTRHGYDQCGQEGYITNITREYAPTDWEMVISVEFGPLDSNTYDECDLEFIVRKQSGFGAFLKEKGL